MPDTRAVPAPRYSRLVAEASRIAADMATSTSLLSTFS
jgi:hypothetical protein